jgi:hypothetical protein
MDCPGGENNENVGFKSRVNIAHMVSSSDPSNGRECYYHRCSISGRTITCLVDDRQCRREE